MQRELSAKLTEGLSYRSIDVLADSTKVPADFIIGYSNHLQSISFQIVGSFSILFHVIISIVLRTIQFNHQSGFRTIKISNVFSKHFLSGKTNRIGS